MPYHHTYRLLLGITLSAWILTACGYHFPGDRAQTHTMWRGTPLVIVGEGALHNPQHTFLLHDRLQTRLGLSAHVPSTAPTRQPAPAQARLTIVLEPVRHTQVTEDRFGRTDRYQVTIQAQPVVEGKPGALLYPTVKATSLYYEPRISTSALEVRKRAESEALDRLTDSLVAILSSRITDDPR